MDTCEHCRGNGAEPGTPIETCPTCGGAGRVRAVTRTAFGQLVREQACDTCGGEGRIPSEPCRECGGRGRRAVRKTLQVDIPAGIADEQRIRLSGRGHAGERGGPPGDLYVLVRVAEDERFIRDGSDLVTVVDVPAPAAALGTKVTVPTLDGDEEIDVAAGHAARDGRDAARARDAGDRPRPPRRPAGGPERGDPPQPERPPERAAGGAARLPDARRTCEEQADESLLSKVKRATALIRLAIRAPAEHAEAVLAELVELAPAGFEQVDGDGWVEFALYGAPGELPELPAGPRRARRHPDRGRRRRNWRRLGRPVARISQTRADRCAFTCARRGTSRRAPRASTS